MGVSGLHNKRWNRDLNTHCNIYSIGTAQRIGIHNSACVMYDKIGAYRIYLVLTRDPQSRYSTN